MSADRWTRILGTNEWVCHKFKWRRGELWLLLPVCRQLNKVTWLGDYCMLHCRDPFLVDFSHWITANERESWDCVAHQCWNDYSTNWDKHCFSCLGDLVDVLDCRILMLIVWTYGHWTLFVCALRSFVLLVAFTSARKLRTRWPRTHCLICDTLQCVGL